MEQVKQVKLLLLLNYILVAAIFRFSVSLIEQFQAV